MLFPLYWVVVTSLKLPIDVNAGPVYLPWVDFTPNLHAWRDLIVTGLGRDHQGPTSTRSSWRSCSTLLCVLIGSMAAYALARIEYAPKFGTILAVRGSRWSAWRSRSACWASTGGVAAAVALAVFVLLARALGRALQARGR